MSISAMLLPEFDQEVANTRKMLERYPSGLGNYKPHPKSMTLERLAGHVAEMPMWAAMTMNTDHLQLDMNSYKPTIAENAQQVVEFFDNGAKDARKLIADATDEDFQKIWRISMNGREMMAMPKIAVLRSMFMNHMIHHRAQLGVYLRMNDIQIPGMYGPTADDPNPFASSQNA